MDDPRLLTVSDLIEREIAAGVPLGPFHRHWLLDRAPEKVRRTLELARKHPHLLMARQGFTSMDTNDPNTAAFGAVASTAAEANIVGSTQAIINQFCAIAANDARAGKQYRATFGGIYSNTSTPTMTWTPRWGTSTTPATNVTLGAAPAWTSITGTSGLPFYGQFDFTIWTAPPGATLGTGRGGGFVLMSIPVTSSQLGAPILMGQTTATVDTTGQGAAGCGLTINLTWGTSSSSNTLTCEHFWLQSLN